MKRILITGGTGFLGRALVDRILEFDDYLLRLVVRDSDKIALSENTEKVEFVETKDIFTETDHFYQRICQDVDVIIHAAWYVEPGKYLDSPLNLTCLNGTIRLAQVAKDSGIPKFIGVGTCFEYDLDYGYLKIDTPLKPTSFYASAKTATYYLCESLFKNSSTQFVWCRLFYLYGDNEDGRRLVPYVKNQLESNMKVELTSGNQIRDYLDVRQAANQIIEQISLNNFGPVNICSGYPVSIKEFVLNIAKDHGKEHLLEFGVRKENSTDPNFVVGKK
jgi:nucleoside-diphosphate-sugar epimerase